MVFFVFCVHIYQIFVCILTFSVKDAHSFIHETPGHFIFEPALHLTKTSHVTGQLVLSNYMLVHGYSKDLSRHYACDIWTDMLRSWLRGTFSKVSRLVSCGHVITVLNLSKVGRLSHNNSANMIYSHIYHSFPQSKSIWL